MRSSRLSWFSNIYLKTLRDYRIAILGWGVGIGALVGLVMAAVPSVLTNAATKASLTSLATSFKWLAEPVGLGTPGGYVTWKYGPTVLVLAIWPLLAGARMLRGEEERGSLDMLLSVPESRIQSPSRSWRPSGPHSWQWASSLRSWSFLAANRRKPDTVWEARWPLLST